MTVLVQAADEAETVRIADELAKRLAAGDVLCLSGDLGAGKTTFTRGLVAGLGSPALVSSPTFSLIHEYPGGRLPVYHVDAYRLRNAEEAEEIGLGEYLGRGDGVTVIEWPERIEPLLPDERLDIELIGRDEARRIVLTPRGERWRAGETLPW
ncbi:MAG: tRNA (adenosine(37)-N6)-threonylcarbamoyltransferase complex ATPase subunit type 1 TsaE [Capsulimonadales bacterium]|nr:tRNA (adenosine(37)-N6)-threonylcarbamoyltransferase complex ATPase subunit type 1 TsaE [Capsulimonadales bacterium]